MQQTTSKPRYCSPMATTPMLHSGIRRRLKLSERGPMVGRGTALKTPGSRGMSSGRSYASPSISTAVRAMPIVSPREERLPARSSRLPLTTKLIAKCGSWRVGEKIDHLCFLLVVAQPQLEWLTCELELPPKLCLFASHSFLVEGLNAKHLFHFLF